MFFGARRLVLAACFTGIGLAGSVGAEVIGYTATQAGRDTLLTSVTVTRGKGPAIFDPKKLIAVRLVGLPDRTSVRGDQVRACGVFCRSLARVSTVGTT